ncbi:MAG: hypothetical protein ABL974_06195 [Prosthecobacter sp.]
MDHQWKHLMLRITKKILFGVLVVILAWLLWFVLSADRFAQERLKQIGLTSATGAGIETIYLSSFFREAQAVHLVSPTVMNPVAVWRGKFNRIDIIKLSSDQHWGAVLNLIQEHISKEQMQNVDWWYGESSDVIAFILVGRLQSGRSLIYIDYF